MWPSFSKEASVEHVMSIVTLCNEKFREGVSPWAGMAATNAEAFPAFMARVVALREGVERPLQLFEHIQHVVFVVVAFQSLESDLVRPSALKLVSLPLWHSLVRSL